MSCACGCDTLCVDVLNSVILVVEGEVLESAQHQAFDDHLAICSPCQLELEHELRTHQLLQDVLRRSCVEIAPQQLHENLHRLLSVQIGGVSEVITEFRMTEISIEIDEFGQIEHREITIEHTQEVRFPKED